MQIKIYDLRTSVDQHDAGGTGMGTALSTLPRMSYIGVQLPFHPR